MPRLPSDEVLGGLPSANSGRPIASFDTSAPARAMSDLGQGIKNLGSGIAKGIESFTEDRDNLALNKAKAGWLTDKVAYDEEVANERDPAKLEAAPQRLVEIANKWRGTLSNPRHQEAWDNDMAPKLAVAGVNVRDKVRSITKDNELADADDLADMMRQIGADPNQSEENREAALEVMNERIDQLQERGYLTAVEATNRRQAWARKYAWSSIRAMAPADRVVAMGDGTTPADVAKAYDGMTESGHADTLMELFRKTGGQVIDPRETAWCAAFVDAILGASGKAKRGSLRAADFLNYGTPTDAPSKGDVVVFKPQAAGSSGHVGFVVGVNPDGSVRYIAGNDSNKVQETTLPLSEVAGFRIPPEAGKSPLPTGASQEFGDKVAKRALDAGRNTRAARMADFLDPDDRIRLRKEAEAELSRQSRDDVSRRKELDAIVKDDVAADLLSIEKTGVEREGLTREKVVAALGPVAAAEWEANRGRARKFYEAFEGA
jgi:uncharacterized protein (TIGR02594 family)